MAFPATAEDLTAMLDSGGIGRGTVVWLNEAQAYLGSPAAAAALRRFLGEGPGGVLMIRSSAGSSQHCQ